jgi:hypothetical protein
VADGLDVVAVRVEHEGSVVPGVVDLADAWPAVVLATGRERSRVEGVDRFAVLGRDADVQSDVVKSRLHGLNDARATAEIVEQ